MATYTLKDCAMYADEYDLSTIHNQHDVTLERDVLQDTRFQQDSHTYIYGLTRATMNHVGIIDTAIDGDAGLFQNDSLLVTTTPQTATEGDVAYMLNGIVSTYTPLTGDIGGLPGFSLSGQSTAQPARGVILHPKTARTSTSSTTGVQHGTISATQVGYAALHVFSGTASTLDVVVQSDNNSGFTTPTNRITFTQASGATSEWGTVSGAISDDYWRVLYTIGGGTWTFAVSFGIA